MAIDDVGFGPAVGAVELGDFLVGIANRIQVDMKSGEEAAVRAGVFVDANGEDGDIGTIVVKLYERGRFLDAGWALAPPEVEQDDFAAVIGKMNGVLAVIDGEVGGDAIGIHGSCSSVACRGEGESEQGTKRDETRKPHVSIIRSGGERKEGGVK